MATIYAAAVVAGVARLLSVMESLPLTRPERAFLADQNRLEEGISLRAMESSGMRLRSGTSHPIANTSNDGDSPTTTAGTLTPSSGDDSSPVQDSFIKTSWRRLSNRWRPSNDSSSDAGGTRDLDHERGYDRFVQVKYEKYPEGFPQLAAYMTSDNDFGPLRGFKYCHYRILLELEVEITDLESRLFELDEADAADPDKHYRLRKMLKHKEGWDTGRIDLMRELKEKLKEYDQILLSHSRIQALGPAPKRNHLSLYNWIWSKKPKPLAPPYYDFAYHNEDFISAVGYRSSYFQELIQNHVSNHPSSPVKTTGEMTVVPKKWLLKTKHERNKTSDTRVNYYSDDWLGRGVRILLVSALVAFLLVPVLLLFLLEMSRAKMAMIASSAIVSFAIFLSNVPGVGEYEFFVGTATYGAVLIMFLGNISQAEA